MTKSHSEFFVQTPDALSQLLLQHLSDMVLPDVNAERLGEEDGDEQAPPQDQLEVHHSSGEPRSQTKEERCQQKETDGEE